VIKERFRYLTGYNNSAPDKIVRTLAKGSKVEGERVHIAFRERKTGKKGRLFTENKVCKVSALRQRRVGEVSVYCQKKRPSRRQSPWRKKNRFSGAQLEGEFPRLAVENPNGKGPEEAGGLRKKRD